MCFVNILHDMNTKVFVSPANNDWKVQTIGKGKAAGIFDTKAEAIARGIELAKNNNAELFIQNKDGKIGSKNSYGNDPKKING